MKKALLYIIAALLLHACSKGDKNVNPYKTQANNGRGQVISDVLIDPNTIQGLHKNIFKPTCANSGCHDGNFEPDFRTIESSYNSLINRNSINTDPANGSIIKRVVPGNASMSMLLHRINNFIPGSQGKMPLQTDPGSDWPIKKEQYISNINKWINDGAMNQLGLKPADIDFPPQCSGMLVFADASPVPLPHDLYSPVYVPETVTNITIMFAYTDDKTIINQFGRSRINFSFNPNVYDSTWLNLPVNSQVYKGQGMESQADYWHAVTVPLSALGNAGDIVWIKTEITDNVNGISQVPSDLTGFNIKKYYAIKIN